MTWNCTPSLIIRRISYSTAAKKPPLCVILQKGSLLIINCSYNSDGTHCFSSTVTCFWQGIVVILITWVLIPLPTVICIENEFLLHMYPSSAFKKIMFSTFWKQLHNCSMTELRYFSQSGQARGPRANADTSKISHTCTPVCWPIHSVSVSFNWLTIRFKKSDFQ